MQETFLQLDRDFQEQQEGAWAHLVRRKGAAAGTRFWPGCTATAALVHDSHLWVANAGVTQALAKCWGLCLLSACGT